MRFTPVRIAYSGCKFRTRRFLHPEPKNEANNATNSTNFHELVYTNLYKRYLVKFV